MVDSSDLGSDAEWRAGSSPASLTKSATETCSLMEGEGPDLKDSFLFTKITPQGEDTS